MIWKIEVMHPPAKHPFHIANEITVSNSKRLQTNRLRRFSKILKCGLQARVRINAINNEIKRKDNKVQVTSKHRNNVKINRVCNILHLRMTKNLYKIQEILHGIS